jgi:hypothetical protein
MALLGLVTAERDANPVRIDYTLLDNTHVNLAYVYLSDAAEDAL